MVVILIDSRYSDYCKLPNGKLKEKDEYLPAVLPKLFDSVSAFRYEAYESILFML